MVILKRKYLFKMPKTKGWKCQKNLPNEKTLPNFEPKGRLRSEAQEKPDAENKLIFCSLKELQHFLNCLLCPRCQKNNLNSESTVYKGIRKFLTLSCSCGFRHGQYMMPWHARG